jgi:pyruvate formate lyase activating enzyme
MKCGICPRRCDLAENPAGFCGGRGNYGRFTAISVDPVEKKPLRHFYPGRPILSAGSYGCNMSCGYCQNHRISQDVPPTEYVAPEKLLELALNVPDNIGAAFTYNEPLISMEYLLDAAPLLREKGLAAVLVTNGYVSEQPLLRLLPHIGAMNIDVKGFSAGWYKELGGCLETVKRTVELCAARTHTEITALIVPGKNDGDGDMERLTCWLAGLSPDIPLHLSRFFPRHRMAETPPTPVETLHRLADIARRRLKYVYVGNV